ncbi:unnamed protein product [Rotaria sp. Silwood2]|nr:unnamed protein product [Rotaria sp. Silwood2]
MVQKIRDLFNQAMEKSDPNYILQAYTAEQKFTHLLNKDMARNVSHDIHQGCTKFGCDTLYTTEDGIKSIASIFFYHPKFITHAGKVYRGKFEKFELEHYQVNQCIMTKTFVSTSKDPNAAEFYSGYDRQKRKLLWEDEEKKISIFWTIIIKNLNGIRRALDISNRSQFPDEQEVLLLPYSVFTITKKEIIELENGKRIEIELEEYEEHK